MRRKKPTWFSKTKNAVSILSDTAVVMLLALGYAENSMEILICRVGISGVMNALNVFLKDEE
jgi:hypothetical protein